MQQMSSPHSRFLTSRKQYWCLKKCSSLDFSFRPELQARPNKRKEHCGRSGGRTLFCQVSTSVIVLSMISSTYQICLMVQSKRKLINCDSFCPHRILTWIIRYLTNMNLLQLQLSDSNFRRCEFILLMN